MLVNHLGVFVFLVAVDQGSAFDYERSCQAYPKCQGLEGDCCPTVAGVMLDCCDAQCSAHEGCVGLPGFCCPAMDGMILECCKESSSECSAHDECASLGLTGSCCPTTDGITLECCSGMTHVETNVSIEAEFDYEKSCQAYPMCQRMEGDCCPTADGVMLDCCDAQCSAHEGCVGLPGFCCPAMDGMILECCKESSSEVLGARRVRKSRLDWLLLPHHGRHHPSNVAVA